MADFMEKTFGSIPGLITGGVASDWESPTSRTRSFRNFVQNVASIKSRQVRVPHYNQFNLYHVYYHGLLANNCVADIIKS